MKTEKNTGFNNDNILRLSSDQDAISWCESLQGTILREVENRKTVRVRLGGETFFVKSHKPLGWSKVTRELIQRGTLIRGAEVEWNAIKEFRHLQIPTVEPCLYASMGKTPASHRSIIVTKALQNKISLEYFSTTNVKLKRRIIERVAEIVRGMHCGGINHRDLYLCHFLMDRDLSKGPLLHLIDLHRAQKRTKVPRRWLIKDLGGLLFSALNKGLTQRDFLRFLRFYFDSSLRISLRDEDFWKAVISRAKNLYIKHERRLPHKIDRLLRFSAATDFQTFIDTGRNVSTPITFSVLIPGKGKKIVKVSKILRVIPRKRIVAIGEVENSIVILKMFFGLSKNRKAKKEIDGLNAIKRAGICCPRVFFLAELESGNAQVVGTEFLNRATSLSEVLRANEIRSSEKDVLPDVVNILATLHKGGVRQEDPHPENFLVDDQKIYCIDGQTVIFSKTHSFRKSNDLRNLALFISHLNLSDDGKINSCLKTYLDLRGWDFSASLTNYFFFELEKTRKKNRRKFLTKIFRDCSEFSSRKSFLSYSVNVRRLGTTSLENFLIDLDSKIAKGKIIKDGNTTTVALVRTDFGSFVIKRYNIKGAFHWASRIFRNTRASKSWRNSHLLRLLGIRTPSPVALVENRLGPLRGVSYFISEYCLGFGAEKLLDKKSFQKESAWLVELLERLSKDLLIHGDLKMTNFLIEEKSASIIDLDAMFQAGSLNSYNRAKKKDMARFMKNWRGYPELEKRFSNLIESSEILG